MRFILTTILAVHLGCLGITDDQEPMQRAGTRAPTAVAPVVDATGLAVKSFLDNVQQYVALRNKVEDTVPPLKETSDPKEIATRERGLGEALVKARSTAQPGDIFVEPFRPVLAKIIKDDFAKRTAAERKALIVELPKGLTFGNNMIYPTTIPLATLPANLLKALPDLPPELEYRIVYRHLILRDGEGNYVADMLTNVFPIPM